MIFSSADILLPNNKISYEKWAVIACDQFTSEPNYWQSVKETAGDAPSALNIVLPEIYLGENNALFAQSINKAMASYVKDGVLTMGVNDGYILVERETKDGTRLGLVGKVDLEHYSYEAKSDCAVRSTEGTVMSRIPPRVEIRKNAPLETPHVLLLMNDPNKSIIEWLYSKRDELYVMYDFELMLGGGHIKGYLVTGEIKDELEKRICAYEEKSQLPYGTGDGNHSLATAKYIWEEVKKGLSAEEQINAPQRFALVELNNIYCEAIVFEPIHRLVFTDRFDDVLAGFKKFAPNGNDLSVTFICGDRRETVAFNYEGSAVHAVQSFLDELGAEVDYIHGEDSLCNLTKDGKATGILLTTIKKDELFTSILKGGALPRKSFSMGHATDKRYYLEARKL